MADELDSNAQMLELLTAFQLDDDCPADVVLASVDWQPQWIPVGILYLPELLAFCWVQVDVDRGGATEPKQRSDLILK